MTKETEAARMAQQIKADLPSIKQEIEHKKELERIAVWEAGREKREQEERAEAILAEKNAKEKALFDASGVVEIFIQLRDQKILTFSNKPVFAVKTVKRDFFDRSISGEKWKKVETRIADFDPAKIILGDNSIRIQFDDIEYGHHEIDASITEGQLVISGKSRNIVGEGVDLIKAIGLAILDPRYVVTRSDNEGNQKMQF